MIDKVIATVNKYNMLREGATVVVAVSGGSDSMALLSVLNEVKDIYKINICVAHVNHCLRGEDADRDERFVCEKCKELGVKVYVKRANVQQMAQEQGMSFEECGRKVRYEFFNSIAENAIIATAHNLDDRAETFFFNFTRGSTLRGLCSIPPVRDNIVRPIIDCTKDEILEYCKKNSVDYVIDATNADVKYARNRIRHNVLPQLKAINSGFEENAGRCINSLNEDEEFLSSLADKYVCDAECENGYSAELLADLPPAIRRRVITKILEKAKEITPEWKAVEGVCNLLEESGKMQINGGVTVRVRKGILDFPEEESDFQQAKELCGKIEFADKTIEGKIVNIEEINNLQKISKQGLEYYLDCDKILGKVVVRSREDGDKITLASRKCTKTLKKLFNELSVPPEKRNSVAVFADENSVILVEGAGVSQNVAVNSQTKKVLKINITGV